MRTAAGGPGQGSASFDEVDFGGVDPGVRTDVVDGLEPERADEHTQAAERPEASLPSPAMADPCDERGEQDDGEVLGGVEGGGGATALAGGEPEGDEPAIAGEDGRLRESGDEPQSHDDREDVRGGQAGDAAYEKRARRPDEDAPSVDRLGAVAIEQGAGGELACNVCPAEAGEQHTDREWIQVQLLLEHDAGDRKHDAVAVAERRAQEQDGEDDVANAGRLFAEQFIGAGGRHYSTPAKMRASSSRSCGLRPTSGGRTGPEGRPIMSIPALTIDTA